MNSRKFIKLLDDLTGWSAVILISYVLFMPLIQFAIIGTILLKSFIIPFVLAIIALLLYCHFDNRCMDLGIE